MQPSEERLRRIEKEKATLRAQLKAAKRKIQTLERQVGRSQDVRINQIEVDLLVRIAECDFEDAFTITFAADLGLPNARLDYHLQRLIDGGYLEVLFTDSALGGNFGITQKGRHALVKRHLL